MSPEFEWPCHKRTAHGPHDDLDTLGMSDEALAEALLRPGSELTCPGVKAHPDTMIGRVHTPPARDEETHDGTED